MKLTISAVLVALVAVSSAAALAQSAKPTGKTLLEIVAKLEQDGYDPITDVSLDRGQWEIEAHKFGTPLELRVDPASGAIVSEHQDDGDPVPPAGAKKLSEIVRGVVAAGYTGIEEISFEGRSWEVEAVRNGTRRELRVDPTTGSIVSDRVDD